MVQRRVVDPARRDLDAAVAALLERARRGYHMSRVDLAALEAGAVACRKAVASLNATVKMIDDAHGAMDEARRALCSCDDAAVRDDALRWTIALLVHAAVCGALILSYRGPVTAAPPAMTGGGLTKKIAEHPQP